MLLSESVSRLLSKDPILLEFLSAGLINISALSEQLQLPCQELVGKKLSKAAIGMALRRYLLALTPVVKTNKKFPAHIDIATQTGIYEVAFRKEKGSENLLYDIRNSIDSAAGEFLSIAEGIYEVVIFTKQKNKKLLAKLLKQHKKNSELDNLACVTVNWPPITKEISGIYYRVTRAMAVAEISIQSFHTVGAEMMLFVKEEQLQRAFEAISKLMKKDFS